MTTAAKINIKNIDYFKFKKIVVDGNRDDFASCSKEVKSLCDSVQTLSFRDEEFDDVSDRARFDEIILYYKQILTSKRIDPTDLRVKNGWWLDVNSGNVCSAGKFKPSALKETLVAKTKDWISRHGTAGTDLKPENVSEKLEGPGLYIFKHKERQCFQYVGKADKIFTRCAEKLRSAFDGTLNEPLGALMIISMAGDWDFYFIPVKQEDGSDILRILENDVILKHDCIWPHGLNFSLHIDSLLEVSEFRKSCLRHHWPPETDVVDEPEINLDRLRRIDNKTIIEEGEEEGKTEPDNGTASLLSPSDHSRRLPSPRDKAPSENGRNEEDRRNKTNTSSSSSSSTHENSSRKPATDSTKQSTRKLTRPFSAPKPHPPARQGGQTRPKSPGFSKEITKKIDTQESTKKIETQESTKKIDTQENIKKIDPQESIKKIDPFHRSLDTNNARNTSAKQTGSSRPLERPRSSLDGRMRVGTIQGEALRNVRASIDVTAGMQRSRSVTSTTSIDSKRDKGKQPAKESRIKAPGVQVSKRPPPPTTEQIIPSPEVQQEPEPDAS